MRKRLSSQAESSVADKSSPLRHITAPEEATQKEEEENAVKLTGSCETHKKPTQLLSKVMAGEFCFLRPKLSP